MQRVQKCVHPSLEDVHSGAHAPKVAAGLDESERLLNVLVYVLAYDLEPNPLFTYAFRAIVAKRPALLSAQMVEGILVKQGFSAAEQAVAVSRLDALWLEEFRRVVEFERTRHDPSNRYYRFEPQLDRLLERIK